jgi:hypothetical protein
MHPMPADPNDALAAFAMYAADRPWVASHLTQLAGVALMVAALLSLTQQLEREISAGYSRLAAGGAIASLAVATALQAVDGIALKVLVDEWANAPVAEKAITFHVALAVRQVEVGLASALNLLVGLTMLAYGAALFGAQTYPKWFAALAIVNGPLALVAGVVMAYTGFSEAAMAISMPASSILLIWMLALGVLMWRQRPIAEESAV